MKSNKERTAEIIDRLNNEGLSATNISAISGGRNSSIYKVTGEGQAYALKIYPELGNGNRIRRERYIYDIADTCCSRYTARKIRESIKNNWMLFSWIDGKKANTFTEVDINQLCNFLSEINNEGNETKNIKVNAADACLSWKTTIIELKRRLNELEKLLRVTPQNKEAVTNYENILNESKKCIRGLEGKKTRTHWKSMSDQKIISPSDMGVHNTLRTQEGVKFIDFEYAGYDDLAKLVTDIVIHPEYQLNKVKVECLINELLGRGLTNDEAWISRYEDIKETRRCIWQTIMLRQYIKGDKETTIDRIVKYGNLKF